MFQMLGLCIVNRDRHCQTALQDKTYIPHKNNGNLFVFILVYHIDIAGYLICKERSGWHLSVIVCPDASSSRRHCVEMRQTLQHRSAPCPGLQRNWVYNLVGCILCINNTEEKIST